MTNPLSSVVEVSLDQQLPAALTPDTRKGYSGYLVSPDQLVEVATQLRDCAGYTYLSSASAVDYLDEGRMEMVYHLYRMTGGPALVLKAQTPRDDPAIPSLIGVYRGAELQEREAWDLFGIRFPGHPDLRRILMWEGFQGHPMRKDWREAYYEEEHKPFGSRWPGGAVRRSEELNPFGHNVRYPKDFVLEGWAPEDGAVVPAAAPTADGDGKKMKTERLVVNLGPQHPSTHGVFRMLATLDGETIVDLQPVMGYLHRNHEKIGERNTFLQNIPYTDRLDYLTSMSNNLGYVLAVEKLQGVRAPERAEYLRVLMVELTRICSHLWATGFLLNDLGAFFTPMLYALEERELILDFFEAVAGSRIMCNYMRFGGVARDVPAGALEKVSELVHERLPRKVDEMEAFLTHNEIIRTRCIGVGALSAEQAVAYSMAGPVLRASGVPYDVRRAEPYGIYDRFDFDVPVRHAGDVYDRYLVRIEEMRQGLRILRQVLRDMPPAGEVLAGKPQYLARVPAGESYGRVENPKGELGYYVVSNGKANPYRYHIRAPSFVNLTALGEMCKGHKVADVVVILGSIDIVVGETDR